MCGTSAKGSPQETGAGVAPLQGTALVLGQSAEHSGVVAELDGPFQTDVNDLAAPADGFGFFDLEQRQARVCDREEQVRVLVQAGSTVAPRHENGLLVLEVGGTIIRLAISALLRAGLAAMPGSGQPSTVPESSVRTDSSLKAVRATPPE